MTAPWSIRAVGLDELEALHDLRLRALLDSPKSFGSSYEVEVVRTPDSRAEWVTEGTVVIAEDEAGWHGLAAALPDRDEGGLVHVLSMWVSPEHRGTGMGVALLTDVLRRAREQGATRARLGVVIGNEPAASLYRAHGFVTTGHHEPLWSDPTYECEFLERSLRPD